MQQRLRELSKLGGRLEQYVGNHIGAAIGLPLSVVSSAELETFDSLSNASSRDAFELDLEAAAVYLLQMQVCGACVAAVFVTLVLPYGTFGISVMRSLTLAGVMGAFLSHAPATVLFTAPRKGKTSYETTPVVLHVFRALRLTLLVVFCILVSEQLLYTSCDQDVSPQAVHRLLGEATRSIFEVAFVAVLLGAAVARAAHPHMALHLSVAGAMAALCGLAIVCAPRPATAAPLLIRMSLAACAERICRTLAFSILCTSTVLASAPKHISRAHPCLLCARGVAAAGWTLVIEPSWLLLLAPVQLIAIVLRRVSQLAEEADESDDECVQAHDLVGDFDTRSANSAGSGDPPDARAPPPDDRRRRLQRILETGKA